MMSVSNMYDDQNEFKLKESLRKLNIILITKPTEFFFGRLRNYKEYTIIYYTYLLQRH